MNKKKRNTWYLSTHVKIIGATVIFSIAVILFAIVNRPPATSDPYNAQNAGAAAGFLSTNGYNLTWNGQKIVLKGANFDNIGALGNSIGTNPSMDAITTTVEDYQRLAQHGGNHARLGLSFVWYKTNQARFFQEMDNQLSWAKANGIWVTFNMFTTPGDCYEGYGNSCAFWGSSSEQNELKNFWVAVATRYKNEPALAGFDVLNEPTPGAAVNWSCSHWFNIAQDIRNAITAADPNHLVFIEACSDPSFDRVFKNADGSKATNVVYEVHDYDPMSITHTENSGAQYPGTHSVWTNNGTEKAIFLNKAQFGGTGPDSSYSTYDKYSIKWAKDNQVPIYIGEWGARAYANSYTQYIKDKGELYNQWEANQAFYTWEHDVSGFWRWGIYQSQRGGMSSSVNTDKLNAFLVSLQGAVRPNFGTGGVTITPGGNTNPTGTPTATGTQSSPVPTNNPGVSTLTISSPLFINKPVPATGETVTGTVTYKNNGSSTITIEDIAIAARPPGGTNSGGPYMDFSPYGGSRTLAAGQSLTFTATRTFTANDTKGRWYAFSTVKVNGSWIDAPASNNVNIFVDTPATSTNPTSIPTSMPTTVPNTPMPTGTFLPEPSKPPILIPTTFPRRLTGSNANLDLLELKWPQGNNIFLEARSTGTKNITQVDWYVNGRWYAHDKSAPYTLLGDQGYTVSANPVNIRAVAYINNSWNYVDATTQYSLGSNTPTTTAVPAPTGVANGYPRQLSGNNSNFKLYEMQPRQGNTVYLQAVGGSVQNAVIVAWYVNGGWKSEDRVAPFYLGSQTSGYTLPGTSATIRVVGFTDYNYNQYQETTFNY